MFIREREPGDLDLLRGLARREKSAEQKDRLLADEHLPRLRERLGAGPTAERSAYGHGFVPFSACCLLRINSGKRGQRVARSTCRESVYSPSTTSPLRMYRSNPCEHLPFNPSRSNANSRSWPCGCS